MAQENDLIKSIASVFSEVTSVGGQYIIPNYQRGYKWSRNDVQKLLTDLLNFERGNGNDQSSFYCLQNITIVPAEGSKNWNVVDGQQRLTTMYILLSYLKKFDNNTEFFSRPDCLDYQVRTNTGKFLKEKVYTGAVWDNEIDPNKAESKDLWYILDVAKAIDDWYKEQRTNHTNQEDGGDIPVLRTSTITDRLKLIVNKMTTGSASEEEIFAGLNGGKVDLDGADLVRAVLITRSTKEKYKGNLAPKVNESRIQIALELDEMNLWWGQEDVRYYFEQFLPENEFKKTIFDHKVHPIGLLYKLYYLIYKRGDSTFGIEFFENGIDFNKQKGDDHWELYESLIRLHRTLKLWYEDSLLYHWVGLLMFRFKGQQTEEIQKVTFKSIWSYWDESTSKLDFLQRIISSIQKLIVDRYKNERNDDGTQKNITELIKNTKRQWYGADPDGIINVLVLMDVMCVTRIYSQYKKETNGKTDKEKNAVSLKDLSTDVKFRLPPQYFTKYKENFEHIRSCAPNPEEGRECKTKSEWVEHINNIYGGISDSDEEDNMKNELLGLLNKFADTLTDGDINKLNGVMNKFGQHSIGNIALLDEHVNKSYGNDPFQKKIQRIFYEYMKNEYYIRPYTLIIFQQKIKDSDKIWRWTQENIRYNAENIAYNVENFLNLKA